MAAQLETEKKPEKKPDWYYDEYEIKKIYLPPNKRDNEYIHNRDPLSIDDFKQILKLRLIGNELKRNEKTIEIKVVNDGPRYGLFIQDVGDKSDWPKNHIHLYPTNDGGHGNLKIVFHKKVGGNSGTDFPLDFALSATCYPKIMRTFLDTNTVLPPCDYDSADIIDDIDREAIDLSKSANAEHTRQVLQAQEAKLQADNVKQVKYKSDMLRTKLLNNLSYSKGNYNELQIIENEDIRCPGCGENKLLKNLAVTRCGADFGPGQCFKVVIDPKTKETKLLYKKGILLGEEEKQLGLTLKRIKHKTSKKQKKHARTKNRKSKKNQAKSTPRKSKKNKRCNK